MASLEGFQKMLVYNQERL